MISSKNFFDSKFFGEKLYNLLPFFSQIIFFWCHLAPKSQKKKLCYTLTYFEFITNPLANPNSNFIPIIATLKLL